MIITIKTFDEVTGELISTLPFEVPEIKASEFHPMHTEICGCRGTMELVNPTTIEEIR